MGTQPRSGNESADQPPPFPFQDLTKWITKEELMNKQRRWEVGENWIKQRKTSVSW
jgi:hypothetical protein